MITFIQGVAVCPSLINPSGDYDVNNLKCIKLMINCCVHIFLSLYILSYCFHVSYAKVFPATTLKKQPLKKHCIWCLQAKMTYMLICIKSGSTYDAFGDTF